MEMKEIINLINSVGFPIFVAIYMLVQGSKDNKQTRETLEKLTVVVEKLCIQLEKKP